LQVRNNQNRSENARYLTKFSLKVMTTFFFNSAKFINFEVSSLGLEFQVSSFGLGLETSDEFLISVSVSKAMVSAT